MSYPAKVPWFLKLGIDDNYLQVTLATNGKSADFNAGEEEPWKHEK